MDENSASRILDSAGKGGHVNPTALAVGIRAAVRECLDHNGMVSMAALYELSCELEKRGSECYD